MKINSLQFVEYNNIKKHTTIEKQHNNYVKTERKSANLVSYPQIYYLLPSFKGEHKNNQLENFEYFIDSLYEANKGKVINDINYQKIIQFKEIEGIPLSNSRKMNNEFLHIIARQIGKKRPQLIDEELLTKAIQNGFDKSFGRYNYEVCTAKDFINQLKLTKILDEKISIDKDSSQIDSIYETVNNELIKIHDEWKEARKEVILDCFINDFIKTLEKNNIQTFDEQRLASLKNELKNEPFLSFEKKLERIEVQKKLNKNYTADDCANDLYNDLTQNKITPFENPKIYSFIAQNDEQLDFLLEKIYGTDEEFVSEMFDKSGFDKKQKVLLIDPAIVNYFDDLVKYVNEKNIDTKEINPFELRKSFSDYLGTETVYRGLYSKDPQDLAEKLKKDGNYSAAFQDKQKAINAIKYFISTDEEPDDTIYSRIIDKIKSKDTKSEFLSASSIYDIAASVPKLVFHPETPVVVIKAEVPKLSLIKQENYFQAMQMSQLHRFLHVGNNKYPYDKYMKEIETFIPFYLPTNNAEILIDTTTPNLMWLDY